MNDAKKLAQLQEIDLEVDEKLEALSRILSQLGDNSILKEAQAAREQANQWLRELEKAQRTSEAEAEDMAAKLHEVEKKLYGGKVTNLKELGSLQDEFEQLKSKQQQKDDRVLEVMGEVEAAQHSLRAQEEGLKQIESQWRQKQEALAQERSALEAAVSQLKEKRERLAAGIESNNLRVYEGLRGTKQTKVVARVEQGRCQGCHLSMSIAELRLVRGNGLVQCSSCHRILFLD